MQDQGKRLLLAVALALGVMLLWNVIFPPKKETPPPVLPGSGQVAVPATSPVGPPSVTPAAPAAPGTVATPGTPGAVVPAPAPMLEVPRGPEELIALHFPKFDATFSSYDGSLIGWKLADPRFQKDGTKGELLPTTQDTGAFQVNFGRGSTFFLPVKTEWKGTKISETEVHYTLSTERFDLEKTFTIIPDVFLVKMTLKATVKVPAGQLADETLALTAFAFQDPDHIAPGTSRSEPRAWFSSTLVDGSIKHTPITSIEKGPRAEGPTSADPTAPGITWTGFEHPYLLVGYAPKIVEPVSRISKFTMESPDKKGLMRTDILFPKATVKAGDPPLAQEIVAYLGPKNYGSLEAADDASGFSTQFKKTIDLGWFSFIGKPLLWLLLKFYAFFGNWGVAIILLTFLVKALTLFWTTKSMRSMKAMAALAPDIKVLQERYKEDRQRQQAETMALYKKHNVNPIAGCLPILLQMPIWLALYRMLSTAGELYQQPFITGWITDLTAPDPFKILPVVLVITMFMQARLTPQTGDNRQQKFLQYGMPLMFGVMSFFFPAGLTLYIFTNTCLSALHSIYMNKFDKKSLAIVAKMKADAEAATAAAAGKSNVKNGAAKAAKPVIEASSTEVTDDADDEESDAPAAQAGGGGAARPRNKKKKRRR